MTFIGSFKNGNLIAEKLSVPESVAPSGRVPVRFDVSNGAAAINAFEPDCCGPECGTNFIGSPLNGYAYRAIIDPQWTDSETVERCLGTTEVGTSTDTVDATFEAPDTTGTYGVTVRVEGQNSKSGVQTTVQTSIEEGGESSPTPGNGDNNGGGLDIAGTIVNNPVKSAVATGAMAVALRLFGND
jgi:hypothetical protein